MEKPPLTLSTILKSDNLYNSKIDCLNNKEYIVDTKTIIIFENFWMCIERWTDNIFFGPFVVLFLQIFFCFS
eukprot:UN21277